MIATRGLIIRKEWLDLILSGKKTWEMRSKPTNVRGPIALIEAGSGLIVGRAQLIDSPEHYTEGHIFRQYAKHRVNDANLLSRWCYPWVLEHARRYVQPTPYNHPKGAVIWVDLTKPGVLSRTERDIQQTESTQAHKTPPAEAAP